VVVEDGGDVFDKPAVVLVELIAVFEHAHDQVLVVGCDGLAVVLHVPAQRFAVLAEVGHGRHIGGELDGDSTLDCSPGKKPASYVLDGDRPRIVVGFVCLLRGAVVPRRATLIGVADQGHGVEPLDGFSRHHGLPACLFASWQIAAGGFRLPLSHRSGPAPRCGAVLA